MLLLQLLKLVGLHYRFICTSVSVCGREATEAGCALIALKAWLLGNLGNGMDRQGRS